MVTKKRHWFWNIIVILTLIGCLLAFIVHYKNWTRVKKGNFEIMSGVYHQKIPFSDIKSVSWADKLPQMERINGFSAFTTEKGKFKDSISQQSVYVFLDDLRQQKIRLKYQDSLQLFLNFKDSLKTQEQFEFFKSKIEE